MSRRLAVALAAALALAACGAAGRRAPKGPLGPDNLPPGVRLTAGERTYDVSAADLPALRRAIDAAGPEIRGERHVASTRWTLDWRYGMATGPFGCSLIEPRVEVTLDTLYPRWIEEGAAAPALSRKWRAFVGALRFHEERHRQNGLAAAAEVQEALRTILPQPDCQLLQRVANDRAEAISEHYQEADRAFDAVTRHGATQGASL